jgi:DNA-directed RNA polymerase specialized sigma24 family protein
LLEDIHAAEDVLQDTMFDAYRGLPRLADTAAYAARLYRIARDRAYRVLRQQRRALQPIEDVEVVGDTEVNGE